MLGGGGGCGKRVGKQSRRERGSRHWRVVVSEMVKEDGALAGWQRRAAGVGVVGAACAAGRLTNSGTPGQTSGRAQRPSSSSSPAGSQRSAATRLTHSASPWHARTLRTHAHAQRRPPGALHAVHTFWTVAPAPKRRVWLVPSARRTRTSTEPSVPASGSGCSDSRPKEGGGGGWGVGVGGQASRPQANGEAGDRTEAGHMHAAHSLPPTCCARRPRAIPRAQ